jgi:tetratricopeptide (TPR) repeat protein
MFAAYACFHLWHIARYRRSELWKPLVILAVCVFAVDIDLAGFGENKIEQDALSHYTLGNAYLDRGDTQKAIAEYEEALDKHRKYGRQGFLVVKRNVEYNLGRLYWADKNCEKAIPHLERVGGNDQFAVIALDMLAECYVAVNRFDRAIDAYELILRVNPNNEKARFGLARAKRRMGDHAGAESLLRSIVAEGAAQDAEVFMEFGLALEALEKWDEAAAAFENASKSPAYRVRALIGAARAHHRAGDTEKAAECIERAREISPGDPEVEKAWKALSGPP